MPKLVSYQGCLMDAQTKIAIEALVLKAQRHHLELNIRYAKENTIDVCGNEHFERSPICHFLKKEAPRYGFVQNQKYPWRFTFVGLKKMVTAKQQ